MVAAENEKLNDFRLKLIVLLGTFTIEVK